MKVFMANVNATNQSNKHQLNIPRSIFLLEVVRETGTCVCYSTPMNQIFAGDLTGKSSFILPSCVMLHRCSVMILTSG